MIDIILWIYFGAIVGWFTWLLTRVSAQGHLLLNIVVGIGGALVGGLAFGAILYPFQPMTFTNLSLVGAMASALTATTLATRYATPSRS